ncbi:MAG: hypothetical protein KBC73_11960 [Burkholderiaceae bacterium]|nr:hypothetical protein [Burkholderiaceae bacterium]
MTQCPLLARLPQLLPALILALPLAAQAQSSPWYLGISQSVGHESNLYRVSDGETLSAPYSKSDTVYASSVLGGLDQMLGRQRLNATASVRASKYQNNSQLDNTGYGLKANLDWQTVGRLSGTLGLSSNQALAQFNTRDGNGNLITQRNTERTNQFDATARLGGVTRLTLEAGLGYRQRDYSAAAYDSRDYRQTYGSAGVRWRSGPQLQLGAALRLTDGKVPRFLLTSSGYQADTYRRTDLDLTANWNPSGNSQFYARLSPTRTRYDRDQARDISGLTGIATWDWRASGKLRLNSRLWRDNGQSADSFSLGAFGQGVVDYGRTTTGLQLGANYDATAKLAATASLSHQRRSLVDTRTLGGVLLSSREGSDNTTSLALGLRWQPTRAVQLGCDLSHEQRSANSSLSWDYNANSLSCYGQFVIQ